MIFQNREDLLMEHLKDAVRVIEIGVRDGDNCKFILRNSPKLKKLYGVDIRYNENAHIEDNRYHYMITDSLSAANVFSDEYFDLIYIDAGHTYNDVVTDLDAWYPKLKIGGFLIGDDYVDMNNPTEGEYGVVQAVEEFAAAYNKQVYLTGYGYIDKSTRLNIAAEIGRKAEDNLYIIHSYLFPHNQEGRVRTENLHIPNWMIIK